MAFTNCITASLWHPQNLGHGVIFSSRNTCPIAGIALRLLDVAICYFLTLLNSSLPLQRSVFFTSTAIPVHLTATSRQMFPFPCRPVFLHYYSGVTPYFIIFLSIRRTFHLATHRIDRSLELDQLRRYQSIRPPRRPADIFAFGVSPQFSSLLQ